MLLIDLHGLVFSSLMVQIANNKKLKVEESLLRHMILNSIRSAVKQFRKQNSEVVIACDSRHYWRKDVFPYYKANRKRDRDDSGMDWPTIFLSFDKIKKELKSVLPYKVIEVDGAEADDIIATMVVRNSPEPTVIFSSDQDFLQLQRFDNVTQYSQHQKKYLTTDNPAATLKEHIIRGDRGDGVPNFMSPDDCFVVGKRQKPINTKKLEVWLNQEPKEFCTTDSILRWYKRNEMLIDLSQIPPSLSKQIVEAYDNPIVGSKNKMMTYFISQKLTNLMEVLDEF